MAGQRSLEKPGIGEWGTTGIGESGTVEVRRVDPAVGVVEPTGPVQHSWMPVSPCGSGCIPDHDKVSWAQAATRAVRLVSVLLAYPVAHVCTLPKRRPGMQRKFARIMLRNLGVRVEIVDERGPERARRPRYAEPGDGILVACSHIGWADILALSSVQPLSFVARADLIDWPVLGPLARLMRVIPIERERLRQLPSVVDEMALRLSAGERVGFFPEGTTWCGRASGTVRPALFQAAVDSGIPVQPVCLRYRDAHGNRSTVPAFIGEDTFLASALRMVRARGITAELVLAPLEQPGTDRRELAQRCARAMRNAELSEAAHAVLAAADLQVRGAA